jgi:hypothetical protein
MAKISPFDQVVDLSLDCQPSREDPYRHPLPCCLLGWRPAAIAAN